MRHKRIRKDINLDSGLIKWVDEQIIKGVYWNFSHCVESLIREKIQREDKKKGA